VLSTKRVVVVENEPLAALPNNAATLKITDVNPFITESSGYTRDEFPGKELWEIGFFSDTEASRELGDLTIKNLANI
jgi:PAS domain-containing protein